MTISLSPKKFCRIESGKKIIIVGFLSEHTHVSTNRDFCPPATPEEAYIRLFMLARHREHPILINTDKLDVSQCDHALKSFIDFFLNRFFPLVLIGFVEAAYPAYVTF